MESKGASVLDLPPYSPDLNPIELSFSKLKTLLRKEKIRDVGSGETARVPSRVGKVFFFNRLQKLPKTQWILSA
jgi:transposase